MARTIVLWAIFVKITNADKLAPNNPEICSMKNSHPDADNTTAQALRALEIEAAESGLNLFQVLSPTDLSAAGLPWPARIQGAEEPGFLLLFGNGGGRLWQQMAQREAREAREEAARVGFSDDCSDQLLTQSADNPLDRASEQLVHDLIRNSPLLSSANYRVLYPGPDTALPLQQLGAIAGWHSDSPLGTGIHPEWGAWFAYRVLLWIELPLGLLDPDLTSETSRPRHDQPHSQGVPVASFAMGDICLSCQSRACVSTCPGKAIEFDASPDMDACARYRLSENSSCADRCKSREACPAGRADRQYTRAQINYHYRVALKGLAHYYGGPLTGDGNS